MKTEKYCEYCGAIATRISYYGDENTIVGGGLGTIFVCDRCIPPCQFPGDPHASYVRESVIEAKEIKMKSYADHTEAEWASLTETKKDAVIEADMDRGLDEAQAKKKATYAAITADPEKAAAHKEDARRAELGYTDAIAETYDSQAGDEDECLGH